jgi:hypothetical protein
MFGNRKDPLVDITKKVMEKSEKDRQVVEEINKELGIQSRKALPHEKRAAYDEFVAQQLAEATSPEKYSEKQKKLAAIAGNPKKIDASDLKAARAGHASHIEEEGSTPTTPREKDLAAKKPPFNKITHGDVLKARGVVTQEESKEPPFDPDPPRKKRPDEPKTAKGLARAAMRDMIKKAEAKKKKLDEEQLDESTRKHFQMVADLIKRHDSQDKRNELASHHSEIFSKQNPRFDKAKFFKASGAEMPKQMDEAAYSAKAARAGKDIGKPVKMFSKIAKKAGERYGSEERGKKVAGAVLAKIRAKHMKEEEQIEEKHLTAAETSKKEELAKKMKKGDWAKRYGERGKSVMYATATKMAKKLAEEDITIQSVQEEIAISLLEKAHWLKENGTQEQVVEFLNNLTMEQRDILNLAEADNQPGFFGSLMNKLHSYGPQGRQQMSQGTSATSDRLDQAQRAALADTTPNVSADRSAGSRAGREGDLDTRPAPTSTAPTTSTAAPSPASRPAAPKPTAPAQTDTGPGTRYGAGGAVERLDRHSAQLGESKSKSLENLLRENFNGKKS